MQVGGAPLLWEMNDATTGFASEFAPSRWRKSAFDHWRIALMAMGTREIGEPSVISYTLLTPTKK